MQVVYCARCTHGIRPDADNRYPPWCPICGTDLKRPVVPSFQGPPPPTDLPLFLSKPPVPADDDIPTVLPADAPLPTRPEVIAQAIQTTPSLAPPRAESPAAEAIRPTLPPVSEVALRSESPEAMNLHLDWREPVEFQRGRDPVQRINIGRTLVLLCVVGSLVFIFLDLFAVFSPLHTPIVQLLVVGVLFLVILPLIYVFVPRRIIYLVTLGPQGISRSQLAPSGSDFVLHGWTLPWNRIEQVIYHERHRLADLIGRALVVRANHGREEVLGIPDNVSRAQIAATLAAWEKTLEDGTTEALSGGRY